MAPYKFPALSHSRAFRLLQLPDDADGIYELHEYSLDEPPEYEALSYVWGDANRDHHAIKIASEAGVDELGITQTLAVALPYLCRARWRRYLWCDQICIEQRDHIERGHQVQMMGDVYRKAFSVTVWLGEGCPFTRQVPALLDQLGIRHSEYSRTQSGDDSSADEDRRREMVTKTLREMMLSRPSPFGSHEKVEVLRHGEWEDGSITDGRKVFMVLKALNKIVLPLLGLPWFKRVWVMQEIMLPQRARILLGSHFFSFSALGRLVKAMEVVQLEDCLLDVDGMSFGLYGNLSGARLLYFMTEYRPKTLSQLLAYVRGIKGPEGLQASDERDFVYGFLGLTNLEKPLTIFPNYSVDYAMVFALTAKAIVTGQRSLEILATCDGVESQFELDGPAIGHALPSWVPDWRYSRGPHTFARLGKSKHPHESTMMSRYDELVVKGKVADRLVFVSAPLFRAVQDFYDCVLDRHELSSSMHDDNEYKTYYLLLKAGLRDCFEKVKQSSGTTLRAHDVLRALWKMIPSWQCSGISDKQLDSKTLDVLVRLYKADRRPFPSPTMLQVRRLLKHWNGAYEGSIPTFGSNICGAGDLPKLFRGAEALRFCRFICIAVTASGRVMLTHDNTSVSDAVVLLRGFSIPAVLRRTPDNFYQYVSAGTCEGLMDETGRSAASWPEEDDEVLVLV